MLNIKLTSVYQIIFEFSWQTPQRLISLIAFHSTREEEELITDLVGIKTFGILGLNAQDPQLLSVIFA